MLIVTYSLVTLSVEQEKTRHVLSTLQHRTQYYTTYPQRLDAAGLESVLNQLTQFDFTCRQRNVELYLIPAIRRATQKADSLLAELESLSGEAANALISARHHLQRDMEPGVQKMMELAGMMGAYCHHVLARLAREEQELFPVARRVITSEEEWFAIASQFISHEAELHAYKPSQAGHGPVDQEPAQAYHHFAARLSTPVLETHE
jgi:hypothetical protein